ncbi:hypothetical protein [Corynebacterium sp. AOP12-C2-36]|uniref:hypothetical protein n=1 Tax=Corynebacterium sp. AOP12-C2-36 TaxID=3457723 RepID=UPI0040339C42
MSIAELSTQQLLLAGLVGGGIFFLVCLLGAVGCVFARSRVIDTDELAADRWTESIQVCSWVAAGTAAALVVLAVLTVAL